MKPSSIPDRFPLAEHLEEWVRDVLNPALESTGKPPVDIYSARIIWAIMEGQKNRAWRQQARVAALWQEGSG